MRQLLAVWFFLVTLATASVLVVPAWGQEDPPPPVAGEAPAPPGEADPADAEDADADAGEEAAAPEQQSQVERIAGRASFSGALLAKLVLFAFLLWLWVRTGDWVNRDAQTHDLGYKKWNAIIVFPFGLLAIIAFFTPVTLWIWLPLLLVVYLGCTIPYVLIHNKAVEPHQTVLTGQWWRYVMASMLGAVGVKVDTERKAEYEKGAAVDVMAMGAADANADNVNLLTARQSPGYLLVKDLVAEMVDRRSERARLDFTSQAVEVRHQIDGVWHPGTARDRASGDVMLAVIKTLCNLDVKERRKRQTGKFAAKYEGKSLLLPMTSEGVKTGRTRGRYGIDGEGKAADLRSPRHARRAAGFLVRDHGPRQGVGHFLRDARRRVNDRDRCVAQRDRSFDARFRGH